MGEHKHDFDQLLGALAEAAIKRADEDPLTAAVVLTFKEAREHPNPNFFKRFGRLARILSVEMGRYDGRNMDIG